MSKKHDKKPGNKEDKRKPVSSPVCYMDQFPEYFGGETDQNSDAEAKRPPQKDMLSLPEP